MIQDLNEWIVIAINSYQPDPVRRVMIPKPGGGHIDCILPLAGGNDPGASSERMPMPAVTMPAHKAGDHLVDYEEKVFEDVKAEPGEKALVTFHTVAFEGSIGLVNLSAASTRSSVPAWLSRSGAI